jgi:hypothetical protein
MALSGIHTNWVNGSYDSDKVNYFKTKENVDLLNTGTIGLTPYQDGSIAIGYGYDLLKNSVSDINYQNRGQRTISTNIG